MTASLLGQARSASAQQHMPSTVTLGGWQERLHMALMDRRHAIGGYYFDRGHFRRLMPIMDHEYLLDMMTYSFTPEQDAAWEQHSGGYRAYMGSIDKSHFATQHHLRHRLSLGHGLDFIAEGYFQEDLRAGRFLVAPGLAYRWGKRHRVGAQQTVARYKPDLDLRLFYELHDPRWGRMRLDVTALDLANNFIFDRLGVDPTLEDTVRVYERRPWLLAAHLEPATYRGLRLELAAGVQLPSRARVSSQNHPDRRFTWRERASYAGVLLAYRLPVLTDAVVGAQYRRTFSRIGRTAPSGSVYTSDYRTRQAFDVFAVFVRTHWQQLHATGRLGRGYYTDRQTGTDFDQSTVAQAFSYQEHFWRARLRLLRLPDGDGLVGGLEYLALQRDYNDEGHVALREADVLTFRQTPWNNRLVLLAGYQFTEDARLVGGIAFDLDGDQFREGRAPVRYDGGFGRMQITW